MSLSGNFFELIFELFYFLLRVSQVFFDFLTHKVVLDMPFGDDIEFYPSLVLGSQLFIALMGLRFVKKFVPLA